MPEIVVHHLNNSRSQRILWFLEELELPYRIQQWTRGSDMRAPRGLREVHPLGFSPIVCVGESVYVESGAILENLIDRVGEGRLRPTDQPELERFRFWMHYAEGSVMPPLLVKLLTGKLRTDPPFFLRPLTGAVGKAIDRQFTDDQIARHFGFINDHLDGREWLLDDFSAADIQMGFPLLASQDRAAGQWPHIAAWLKRCTARPAFQRGSEKGGELSF